MLFTGINFALVAPHHRVGFMPVGNVTWNIILDWIANNTEDAPTVIEDGSSEFLAVSAEQVDPLLEASETKAAVVNKLT